MKLLSSKRQPKRASFVTNDYSRHTVQKTLPSIRFPTSDGPMRLSIIIPAYNEAATLETVLRRIAENAHPTVEFEVIVVDDGSSDATSDILDGNSELYSKAIVRSTNGGKGAAVRDGLLAATGDYILFQDADLEYDPADYGRLLKPVLEQRADVVVGSRNLAPDYVRVHYFWHLLGNKTITLLFNILNNLTFTDIYSCYLLYRRNLVEPAKLKDDGWAQHAEILGTVARRAKIIYEVPVNYTGRTYDEGKKIRYWHVVSVIWMILRIRFSVL